MRLGSAHGGTYGSGDQGGSASHHRRIGQPFAIRGGAEFAPYYHPESIVEVKERTPSREENFCDGEDVADNGSKNREIQIMGQAQQYELSQLTAIGDYDDAITLISVLFSGEVYLLKVKKKTTGRWDPFRQEWMFDYTINLLSSGRDEGHSMSNGIISGGGG